MKNLVPALSALALYCCAAAAHAAQPQGLLPNPNQTDSAVTAETRRIHLNTAANILAAARAMPERFYNARPTAKSRSFAEIVRAIAASESSLCGNINGRAPTRQPAQTTKAALVALLEQTTTQCHSAFVELSAENAAQKIETADGDISHIAALVRVTTEEAEGYGAMKIYFALNGLQVPPSQDGIGASGRAPVRGS